MMHACDKSLVQAQLFQQVLEDSDGHRPGVMWHCAIDGDALQLGSVLLHCNLELLQAFGVCLCGCVWSYIALSLIQVAIASVIVHGYPCQEHLLNVANEMSSPLPSGQFR